MVSSENSNYDMKGYIEKAEEIAKMKVQMYKKLIHSIKVFKEKFGSEY